MQFVEFIEALSRAAFHACVPMVIIDPKTRAKTVIDMRDKPLADKLESIMPLLLKLLPRHVQERFKWPEESPLAVMNVKDKRKRTVRTKELTPISATTNNESNSGSNRPTPRSTTMITPNITPRNI